jgi:hypothetical protein
MDTPASASGDLQFDTVAPPSGDGFAMARACAVCKTPISSTYHLANGQVICPGCRVRLEAGDAGSASGRIGRALLFGTGAAVAGGALYYAVVALTDTQWALIAILVGYMVGRAVHTGARGKGGWVYQTMAVGLTYLAIAGSFVPLVVGAAAEQGSEFSGVALYLTAIIGSLLLPVTVVTESPLITLIIAFGLYQAWKQTRAPQLAITGPFSMAPAASAAPVAATAASE